MTVTLTEIQEALQDYLNAAAEAVRVYEKGGFTDHYALAIEDAVLYQKRYNDLVEKSHE